MLIKVIVVILVLGILFVFAAGRDRRMQRMRLKEVLKQEWGMYTRDEYSDAIMENIKYYHEQKKTGHSVDDITWNDLNMEAIFQQLNHTRTSAGEEYLYHLLRTPEYSEGELEKRETVIRSIQEHPELREEFELSLYDIGKTDRISVYRHLCGAKNLHLVKRWPHVCSALILLGGAVLVFFSSPAVLFLLFFIMGANAYFYYKEKEKILKDIALYEFILGTVRQCSQIGRMVLPECEGYFIRLKELAVKFRKFCRFHFLVSGGNTMSGSLFDSVFDYIRILFHVDLIKISTMAKEVTKYEKELLEIYGIIGFLDSMLAAASYRQMLGDYGIPELYSADGRDDICRMEIKGLYHPLLSHPVKNDIAADRCMLLTGSNASGKSTFIKAVAVSALFAQTIHTVPADSYKACFYRIYSSMALRDDILSNESYFIVEIKSLKRIFEKAKEPGVPVLCFIDEILRGTNTVERVAASSKLLEALSRENAMCFAATHDIELTYLLEGQYANYHFSEHIKEEDITFDYQLKKGRADSRNAIRLLAMVGFERELVEQSMKRVEAFLSEGVWQ
ncbi:MAG: AAA family ATPase [Lachnospiraceae bacterium]|nr:AAA family ATPase [Lachnospiraceae bacterium]